MIDNRRPAWKRASLALVVLSFGTMVGCGGAQAPDPESGGGAADACLSLRTDSASTLTVTCGSQTRRATRRAPRDIR